MIWNWFSKIEISQKLLIFNFIGCGVDAIMYKLYNLLIKAAIEIDIQNLITGWDLVVIGWQLNRISTAPNLSVRFSKEEQTYYLLICIQPSLQQWNFSSSSSLGSCHLLSSAKNAFESILLSADILLEVMPWNK